MRADPLALEIPCCCEGVLDLSHSRRLEETLGALVRREQRFHFLAQGLVASAAFGQVRRTSFRRQHPRAREHLFQALPIIRGEVPRAVNPSPARSFRGSCR